MKNNGSNESKSHLVKEQWNEIFVAALQQVAPDFPISTKKTEIGQAIDVALRLAADPTITSWTDAETEDLFQEVMRMDEGTVQSGLNLSWFQRLNNFYRNNQTAVDFITFTIVFGVVNAYLASAVAPALYAQLGETAFDSFYVAWAGRIPSKLWNPIEYAFYYLPMKKKISNLAYNNSGIISTVGSMLLTNVTKVIYGTVSGTIKFVNGFFPRFVPAVSVPADGPKDDWEIVDSGVGHTPDDDAGDAPVAIAAKDEVSAEVEGVDYIPVSCSTKDRGDNEPDDSSNAGAGALVTNVDTKVLENLGKNAEPTTIVAPSESTAATQANLIPTPKEKDLGEAVLEKNTANLLAKKTQLEKRCSEVMTDITSSSVTRFQRAVK